MIATIINILVVSAVVFLPLGTRWIITPGVLNNGLWEYGTVSVYASEVMVWLAAAVILAQAGIQFIKKIHSNSSAVLDSRVHGNDTKKVWFALPVLAILFYLSYRGQNLGWLLHLVSGVLLIVVLRRNREHLISIAAAFLATTSMQVLLGLVQLLTQRVWSSTVLGVAAQVPHVPGASVVGTALGRMLRAYGTLPHPNLLGAYSVVGLALSLWMLRYKVSSRMHGALIGSTALFGMGAAISFSRAAWIGMALVLVVAALGARHRSMHEKVAVMGSGLIAIAGLVMCFIFWRQAVIPRILLKTDFGVNERAPLEARSLDERAGSLREAVQIFERHPFLGVGGGNYTRAVHDELDSKRESWGYQPVHNVILFILVELGIVGFIAFIILLVLSKPQFGLGLIALIPFMLTDHFLWSLWPGLALMAFVLGVSKSPALQVLDPFKSLDRVSKHDLRK